MATIPAISIITPVYNGFPYLKECVESVLAQDLQDWELLISDDGSNDGSREYLDTFTDPRIQVFKQEKNRGIFGNLNFIFSRAKAPVSQILCQDDFLVGEKALSTIIGYWKTAPPEIGFVKFNHTGPSACRTIDLEKKMTPEVLSTNISDLWFFVFGNFPDNLSNNSLRTELVANIGWFREDLPYSGDFDFWSRAARSYPTGVQKTTVSFIRRHPGVASNFLNLKGEQIRQKHIIVSTIYNSIISRYPKAAWLIKLQGTLNYDSLQRDVAFHRIIHGHGWHYLRELNRIHRDAAFVHGQGARWMFFLISAGGRLLRASLAKYVISKLVLK